MSKVFQSSRRALRALRRNLNHAAVMLAGWAAVARLVALILFELLKPGRPEYRRAGRRAAHG
jgi:hypothetical protein